MISNLEVDISNIEKLYTNYTIRNKAINSKELLIDYLKIKILDIDEQIDNILREVKINSKEKTKAKLLNLFLGFIYNFNTEIYEEDNIILIEEWTFLIKFKEYHQKLINLVTTQNIKEIVKLLDFSLDYYNKHLDYLENKRDALEYYYDGINYSFCYKNDLEEMDVFIKKQLNHLSSSSSK